MYRENGKIIAEAETAIYPPQGEYSHQLLFDYTKQLKSKYEEWITKDPSSWLWAHNRWKREKDCIKFMKIQDEKMRLEAAKKAQDTPKEGAENAL